MIVVLGSAQVILLISRINVPEIGVINPYIFVFDPKMVSLTNPLLSTSGKCLPCGILLSGPPMEDCTG